MIVIDFDGTIVDVWDRYYKIFIEFWKTKALSKLEYVQYKRTWKNDEELIQQLLGEVAEEELKNYQTFKKEKLEDCNYLKLDSVIVNKDMLYSLSEMQNIIVLTVRRNKEQFLSLLDFLGLSFLKESAVILQPKDMFVKKDWVENNLDKNEELWVIGDAETDVNIGLLSNAKVCVVRTGLRSENQLNKLHIPFQTFENINKALDEIKSFYE